MKWHKVLTICLVGCFLFFLTGCNTASKDKSLSASKLQSSAPAVEPTPTYPYYEFQEKRVWGYLDQDGKPIITPQFESAGLFDHNGVAIVSVSKDGQDVQYGLIDRSGHFIVQPEYFSIKAYQEGIYVANKYDKSSSIFDPKGNLVKTLPGEIRDFSEGKAILWSDHVYGYVDSKGEYIAEPKFASAVPFQNGKAVVKITEGKYAVINEKGEVLHNYDAFFLKGFNEGLAAVQPSKDSKYGYLNENGELVIDAKYEMAEDFHEGLAAVWTNMFKNTAGLINTKGEYVIPALYGNIRYIGNSVWAVSHKYRDDYTSSSDALRFALFDKEGKQLTDFIYDAVEPFAGEYAVAEQGLTTFFIDKSGKKVDSMPTIDGIGTVTRQGDVISADVDGKLSYMTTTGQIIWSTGIHKQDLGNGISLTEGRYRPDRDILINYPVLKGFKDSDTEARLNDTLKKQALQITNLGKSDGKGIQRQDIQAGYSVTSAQQNLLVLELSYYAYSGGAHGMPGRSHLHIDLQSGHIYELQDLFKPDSPYIQEISRLLKEQMKANGKELGMFETSIEKFQTIQPNQPFFIKNDMLNIYFPPYEMGPYAAGFITMQIPLADLDAVLNKEGAFWKSFHGMKN